MIDDHVILEACQNLPLGQLLRDGLKAESEEAGDFWWVESKHIFFYFRPLLLLTFKLPILLGPQADLIQHLLNMVLHLSVAVLLLALARKLFQNGPVALFVAVFFAVSIHHGFTVQWIAVRKESLAGLLLLAAFFLHMKGRWQRATLLLLGALLTAEQAVIFPGLVLLWDFLASKRKEKIRRLIGRPWIVYFGCILVYLFLRTLFLGGASIPAPPYFNSPLGSEFWLLAPLKMLEFFFSLIVSIPYTDPRTVAVWLKSPGVPVATVLLLIFAVVLLIGAKEKRRLSLTFFLLSLVAFLPFLPMTTLPFYMYTPMVFFSLAVGAALQGFCLTSGRGTLQWARGRALGLLAGTAVLFNIAGGLWLSWGPFGDYLKIPPRLLHSIANLLEGQPKDRHVFFVDLPAKFPPPFFLFSKQLSSLTGRDPGRMAVLTFWPPQGSSRPPDIHFQPSGFVLQGHSATYFSSPLERIESLLPEDLLSAGRTFEKPWYAVMIKEVLRPHHSLPASTNFFAQGGGIQSLEVRLKEGIPPPLIVGFCDGNPYILSDGFPGLTKKDPAPCRSGGIGDLLRRLAEGDKNPPRAYKIPVALKVMSGGTPKPGLGQLLAKMAQMDPAFQDAYSKFLHYLDGLNDQLAQAGAGPFRMETSTPGDEHYARSIEAMGGMSTVLVKPNALGITWDSIMETARSLASRALHEKSPGLNGRERDDLINLLGLAQLAAVSNQVVPNDYLQEWEKKRPERPRPPDTAPPGIPRDIWEGVGKSIPWMCHAGALPWESGESTNPYQFYDSFHFFSTAWMACYGLFRTRYTESQSFQHNEFSRQDIGSWDVQRELVLSRFASVTYEMLMNYINHGFLEVTPAELSPGLLRPLGRFLKIKGFPYIEALRDVRVGEEGSRFGAALAISGRFLQPSDRESHRRVLKNL